MPFSGSQSLRPVATVHPGGPTIRQTLSDRFSCLASDAVLIGRLFETYPPCTHPPFCTQPKRAYEVLCTPGPCVGAEFWSLFQWHGSHLLRSEQYILEITFLEGGIYLFGFEMKSCCVALAGLEHYVVALAGLKLAEMCLPLPCEYRN